MATIIYNKSLNAWVEVKGNEVIKEKELKPKSKSNVKHKSRGIDKNNSDSERHDDKSEL